MDALCGQLVQVGSLHVDGTRVKGPRVHPLFHDFQEGKPGNTVTKAARLFETPSQWSDGTFSTMQHVAKQDDDTVVIYNNAT